MRVRHPAQKIKRGKNKIGILPSIMTEEEIARASLLEESFLELEGNHIEKDAFLGNIYQNSTAVDIKQIGLISRNPTQVMSLD